MSTRRDAAAAPCPGDAVLVGPWPNFLGGGYSCEDEALVRAFGGPLYDDVDDARFASATLCAPGEVAASWPSWLGGGVACLTAPPPPPPPHGLDGVPVAAVAGVAARDDDDDDDDDDDARERLDQLVSAQATRLRDARAPPPPTPPPWTTVDVRPMEALERDGTRSGWWSDALASPPSPSPSPPIPPPSSRLEYWFSLPTLFIVLGAPALCCAFVARRARRARRWRGLDDHDARITRAKELLGASAASVASAEPVRGGGGGGGGETASHTTPFAWCTPFLEDFARRHSSPALPFQRLTGKTFD